MLCMGQGLLLTVCCRKRVLQEKCSGPTRMCWQSRVLQDNECADPAYMSARLWIASTRVLTQHTSQQTCAL